MLPHIRNRRIVEAIAAEYLVERDAARNREERRAAKDRYFQRTESVRAMAEKIWEEMMIGGFRPKVLNKSPASLERVGLPVVVVMPCGKKKEFPSLTTAAEEMNYSITQVWHILHGHLKRPPFRVYLQKGKQRKWSGRPKVPIVVVSAEGKETFPSVTDASISLNMSAGHISNILNGHVQRTDIKIYRL